jgi:hypothetical protein
MKSFYYFLLILVLALLSGCSTLGTQRDVSGPVPLNRSVSEIPENQLLDVWVEVFDPGELPANAGDASGLSLDIQDRLLGRGAHGAPWYGRQRGAGVREDPGL